VGYFSHCAEEVTDQQSAELRAMAKHADRAKDARIP